MKSLFNIYSVIALASLLLASCASKKTVTLKQVKATSGLEKYNSNYDYVKDENGLMRASSDQKSQFSRDKKFAGTQDFSGKDYSKKSYRKKRWGETSQYDKKSYAGNNNSEYKRSPYYVQQQSKLGGESRYSGNQYEKQGYTVDRTANVATGNNKVSKAPSGYVTSRANYPDPVIMSKSQYSKVNGGKLTVKETNSMLGR